MKNEREHREEVIRIGKLLHDTGFVAATSGNISVRLDETKLLMTPSGIAKGMMTAGDLIMVDLNGRKLSGNGEATSEMFMHLLIYGLRPDVRGIVHAHPPTATGYAAAGLALDQPLISEVVLSLGCVPLAPYATPGTQELGETLRPLIPQHDAILMANHGVVAYGNDLLSAYMKMETVEHYAKVALVARQLGPKLLSEEEVSKLAAARDKYRKR